MHIVDEDDDRLVSRSSFGKTPQSPELFLPQGHRVNALHGRVELAGKCPYLFLNVRIIADTELPDEVATHPDASVTAVGWVRGPNHQGVPRDLIGEFVEKPGLADTRIARHENQPGPACTRCSSPLRQQKLEIIGPSDKRCRGQIRRGGRRA